MQALADYGVCETRIFFPTRDYVQQYTEPGEGIAFACRLNSWDRYSSVNLNYNDVNNIVMEMMRKVRRLEEAQRPRTPFTRVMEDLLGDKLDLDVEGRGALAEQLQTVLDAYYMGRAIDTARTTRSPELVDGRSNKPLLRRINRGNNLVNFTRRLLLNEDSPLNRHRKNSFAVAVQGLIVLLYDFDSEL